MDKTPITVDAAIIPEARFLGGTLVLEGVGREIIPPAPFQWVDAKWRCPALHYRTIRDWLKDNGIRNTIPRWRTLKLTLHDDREPHAYQEEALRTWRETECWGSVVLPTGAGKTFLALRAIADRAVSTLVIVPTLDLLHQWYARLTDAFGCEIGVWYGQEKLLQPLTVTTYPSAWAQAELFGNQFKFLIFDEVHHLPAPSWHEIALMCAAPYRLGLTATYPTTEAQKDAGKDAPQGTGGQLPLVVREDRLAYLGKMAVGDPAGLLREVIGPVVYHKAIDALTGEQLAEYRTERIRVELNAEERAAYDAAYAVYTGYVRKARLRESHGPGWWHEFTRRSAYQAEARKAKVAELKLKEIVHQAQEKLVVLDRLLREYADRPMLIFTEHNRLAYKIARQHLIPVITHQTSAAERKLILDTFREGGYRAIVTSKVLNEGVDVPAAKIAVVLGGSASAREYVQRLGRVLRKRGNLEALLIEVIARHTVDERISRRRRRNAYGVSR